jgi:hypothetical protein
METLVHGGLPTFEILPHWFEDGSRSCRLDDRFPDPFVADGMWTGGESVEEGAG